VERPQPGGTRQAASGEDDQRLPASHQGSQPADAGHAELALVALNELVAQPPEHESAQPLMLKHFSADEVERLRHHRGQHQPVDPAGMVDHRDGGPGRQLVEAVHGEDSWTYSFGDVQFHGDVSSVSMAAGSIAEVGLNQPE
jgi:hypothetical protein